MSLTSADRDSAQDKMLGADTSAPVRGGETMTDNEGNNGVPDLEWLKMAEQAFEQSKSYYETTLRTEWKEGIAHFRSEHAAGSKYHKTEYAKRSRVFRPKTRSMVLRKEASAAGAFFAQEDVCTISPADPDNSRARAAAAVTNAILNHRMTVDVPWFLILQGNYQTALIQGICCSKNYWEYEAILADVPVHEPVMGEDGQTPLMSPDGVTPITRVTMKKQHVGAKIDRPKIDPVAPENIRFHPNSNWLDPVNTSPYIIYTFPMFVIDVKQRAKDVDPKTNQPQWKAVDDDTLAKAAREYAETLDIRDRKRREVEQAASKQMKDFDVVWVHENFMRHEGDDYVYYTLGATEMLSDPKPIKEIYLHGVRPFTIGIASLEAFTPNPQSKVKQLAPVQRLANEIANQRIDNVRLAMNGRYWVKSGRNVDLQVLTHSTPGSAVLMGDPQTDVKWDRPADVTASAYQEQDRINVDFDDLGGVMSAGTVQSDRKLNETVGGMNIMSSDANAVQEYELRVFAMTYVEPTLRQLVLLEQAYESDKTILALGGKQAQSFQKFGIDPTNDDVMNEKLLVTVSVGIGATAPAQRMDKLTKAFTTFWGVAGPLIQIYGPAVIQSPGVKRMASEIFGAAGYKDVDQLLDYGPPPPPPGQQQAPPEAKPGIDPQVAQQAMQVEQQENEKDRDSRLAETRIRDSGQTTRTIIQAHKDMIISAIRSGQGGGNVVPIRPVQNDIPPIPMIPPARGGQLTV